MKTSQERVMKNPKGSPKKQDFLSLKLESCISGSIRSFLIFRAASYFVKHKSVFFCFFFGGGGGLFPEIIRKKWEIINLENI